MGTRNRSLRCVSSRDSRNHALRPRPGPGRPIRADAARRRARPEAEALDPRLLMARQPAAASPDLADRVAQVVQPYLAQGQFPGITVAVVTDGQVTLAQGYGVANVKTGSPVEADTRFDIGSVTKTFTAMGVLLLYQESQGTSHPLDLDAPIGQYLHNTRSFKLPRRWSQVTTRELLDMTSGIHDVEDARPWKAQLKSIAKDPLRFAPGTEASYSNSNYLLLGELIEQMSGEKYGTFIQDRILDPLGMSGDPGAGRVRHGLEPGGRLQRAPAREMAEGRVVDRNRDVRRRRHGLDGPGHGHLHDGAPGRPSARSRDLRDDVDRDTDSAVRVESPVRRRVRPGMG